MGIYSNLELSGIAEYELVHVTLVILEASAVESLCRPCVCGEANIKYSSGGRWA